MILKSLKGRPRLHKEVVAILCEKVISGEFPEKTLLLLNPSTTENAITFGRARPR